jgi:5-formyltetrahydrofolate cyclo-ligase
VDKTNRDKDEIRNRVWDVLRQARAAPRDVHGRIPAFNGAADAAERLAALEVWRRAEVVKANPDRAQLPVRIRALDAGKLLYMAVPRLAAERPFYVLDPHHREVPTKDAATSAVARRIASTADVDAMNPVDLIVCGSVAVDHRGARLGKGAGYSDIEVALLADAGLISDDTTIATTVHDLQVLDEPLPHADHDFTVDLIVTPTTVIQCGPPHRPPGLTWQTLSPDQIAAIPALRNRATRRG